MEKPPLPPPGPPPRIECVACGMLNGPDYRHNSWICRLIDWFFGDEPVRKQVIEHRQSNGGLTVQEAYELGKNYSLPIVSPNKEVQEAFANAAAMKIAFESSSQTT